MRSHVAIAGLALFLAGCGMFSSDDAATAQSATTVSDIYPRFESHMLACSETHGFDPKAAGEIDEYSLAPGEPAWRDCVYDGVERYIVPHSGFPSLYRRVVAEDRMMTDRIARREMTRSERRARLDLMIAQIEAKEAGQRQVRLDQALAVEDLVRRDELYGSAEMANRQALDSVRALRAFQGVPKPN